MTRSMQASLTAIGRQLNEDYQPTLAKPLPTELKDLVARLVALEDQQARIEQAGHRGAAGAHCAAGAEGVTDRVISRTTDEIGQSSWNVPLHCCPDQLPTSF